MNSTREHIPDPFGVGPMPAPSALVVNDGFGELDKAMAVEFFSGKTWQDVHAYLRENEYYCFEELSSLDTNALQYYFRAYYEYALDSLSEQCPNDDYLTNLFRELYQAKYMGKFALLSNEGQASIDELAAYAKGHRAIESLDPEDRNDLLEAITRFERDS